MPSPIIKRAWLDSIRSAIVEFEKDWIEPDLPALALEPGSPAVASLAPAPLSVAGRSWGYAVSGPGMLSFVLPLEHGCAIDPGRDRVYVAGDFNEWGNAVGKPEWELKAAELDGEAVLLWTGPQKKLLQPDRQRFKFATGENLWLGLPDDAPNSVRDGAGNVNRFIDQFRTGRHLWRFELAAPLDLAEPHFVSGGPDGPRVPLMPGRFFFELGTALPLGALARATETTFRLFAPRARSVTLFLCDDLAKAGEARRFELSRREDAEGAAGVWELVLDQNLHCWFYWYSVDGVREGPGRFDPAARVLDPYALAAVSRDGPGIILEREWVGRADRTFRTPAWQDLVIVEAHVRDLTAAVPGRASQGRAQGFSGLRDWVENPNFYLHRLGINCVELQPVQEFDNRTPDEYHWGYMTNNFFAPDSSYSLAPAQATGVRELQALVAAFHRRGMAVILDVVFNHVGVPPHLMAIDRLYYFEQDAEGNLANWSGCGNDLRADAAMATRLIIDSCSHLIEAYGVDGFRFDLAELLGIEVLREVEKALKRLKSNVILIAEPWSFRGHIAGALRDTGFASWNDGFRDFVRDYVLNRGAGDRLEYFLRGSPWYFAKWPAQTVNYTESHDDRTWIDMITENPGGDGFAPTSDDRRRTHLMAAILFMSLGIPMLAAGQDFLRSKRGVTNTYQRGDLNALDYSRLRRFPGTHAYFKDWIAFRRGPSGRLLRQYSRPGEGFFQFFHPADAGPSAATLAALYNADLSQGPTRLLFAVNPTKDDAAIPIGGAASSPSAWRQVADHERFYDAAGGPGTLMPNDYELFVPSMSCGLWLSEG
jgi:pullulanase/glycogen debranching enzyme